MNDSRASQVRFMKYLLPVLALSVLFNIPKFFEAEIKYDYENNETRCRFSPTFYGWLFRSKVSSAAFLYLDFMFELYLAQDYWRKCAHKMLVKLTLARTSTKPQTTKFRP